MKKIIWISAVIVVICIIITFLIIPAMAKSTSNNQQNNQITTATEPMYIITSENDRIVVYDKFTSKPKKVTETVVSVLPKEDQENLEKGIEVTGDKALQKALEDYCS